MSSVTCAQTLEVMALHNSGETFTFRDSGYINFFTGAKYIGADYLTYFVTRKVFYSKLG